VVIDGVTTGSNYNRSLDLDTGLHTTSYKGNDGNTYTSTVYCSYPDQVCVYDLVSSSILPKVTVSLENQLTTGPLSTSCGSDAVVLHGLTQAGPPLGMQYLGKAQLVGINTSTCTGSSLVVPSSSKLKKLSIVWSAITNYDQQAGTSASSFSFAMPGSSSNNTSTLLGPTVTAITSAAAAKSESELRDAHVADYTSLTGQFTLSLPDTASSAGLETSAIISRYSSAGAGDPYLESTLFALGRHMFISSSRANSLPPNLAGRWSETLSASWGADYHADINFQMNHWSADQTGLGDLQVAMFNYMQDTWVPRGTETAQLLYGAPGWVVHDEMNIFGHTGMKYSAQWADYPVAAAWMMTHVFDHYSYSQNTTWFLAQGYPLMKGVAQFWLSQLQKDGFFDDGTLVVNPCNSPEHGPTTFACTHYQQLIHQIFSSLLSVSSLLPSSESSFTANISTALETLDKGLHIGSWGEIKEWKIPDKYGYDFENDTHRHLSNLVGWYPGYSLASLLDGYSNATIHNAVATSLYSRGWGNGPDANAGWEKVWRSACWARLNNSQNAYYELKYAIDQNFANNGLSMYSGTSKPFQIDANFGLLGAVTSMLVVDLPAVKSGERSVVLGPAIPATWGGGSVKGLRVRGGGSVDFSWDSTGLVTAASPSSGVKGVRFVDKKGGVLATT
jgi:alpha-L-fucosidase 2